MLKNQRRGTVIDLKTFDQAHKSRDRHGSNAGAARPLSSLSDQSVDSEEHSYAVYEQDLDKGH